MQPLSLGIERRLLSGWPRGCAWMYVGSNRGCADTGVGKGLRSGLCSDVGGLSRCGECRHSGRDGAQSGHSSFPSFFSINWWRGGRGLCWFWSSVVGGVLVARSTGGNVRLRFRLQRDKHSGDMDYTTNIRRGARLLCGNARLRLWLRRGSLPLWVRLGSPSRSSDALRPKRTGLEHVQPWSTLTQPDTESIT